jgi:hypothetical protein
MLNSIRAASLRANKSTEHNKSLTTAKQLNWRKRSTPSRKSFLAIIGQLAVSTPGDKEHRPSGVIKFGMGLGKESNRKS